MSISYNRFDSYYYSRPVSYICESRSGLVKPNYLQKDDPQSKQVLDLLAKYGMRDVQDLGGLDYGIKFADVELGRKNFNFNTQLYYSGAEYHLYQHKRGEHLNIYHPVSD